ncbi:carbamoyl-phosphate synthase, partial [bacterium]|nr:carbamoyl-phosphate synthase [bacterium]
DTEQQLNRAFQGGALDTYGLDVGYAITPEWDASIGYYYQSGDLGEADGSGVQAGLDYQIAYGLTAGINVSYDEAFETRVSGNIEYRFGSNSAAAETKKKAWQKPTIQALSESVKNRNIRVHDAAGSCKVFDPRNGNFLWSVAPSYENRPSLNISYWDPQIRGHCSPGAKDATPGGWAPA